MEDCLDRQKDQIRENVLLQGCSLQKIEEKDRSEKEECVGDGVNKSCKSILMN